MGTGNESDLVEYPDESIKPQEACQVNELDVKCAHSLESLGYEEARFG